jgi:hypothetical protein
MARAAFDLHQTDSRLVFLREVSCEIIEAVDGNGGIQWVSCFGSVLGQRLA